mmetsp:Transcript_60132/g.122688  ORF Transcript_60132/g.122688 Transcript_60132/m.122688 type:complete len:210 (+) Transcript_60132:151-780(+)
MAKASGKARGRMTAEAARGKARARMTAEATTVGARAVPAAARARTGAGAARVPTGVAAVVPRIVGTPGRSLWAVPARIGTLPGSPRARQIGRARNPVARTVGAVARKTPGAQARVRAAGKRILGGRRTPLGTTRAATVAAASGIRKRRICRDGAARRPHLTGMVVGAAAPAARGASMTVGRLQMQAMAEVVAAGQVALWAAPVVFGLPP